MWDLLIIIGGLVGFIALLANRLQVYFIRKELRKPFHGLSTELPRTWATSRIWNFATQNAVVGSASAVNTGQVLYHLSQIDTGVLEAIDKIYDPSQVNNYRQILSHLSAKQESGEAAWAGAVSNYKGRLGEQYLAENLRANGHLVEFAESTNQEGWDAVVDGQAVNFKAGLGTDHITEHLERFPDIPVITVAEHADTFSSSSQITCLEEVSGHYIAETTERTMQSAVDLGDFGLELPLITMAVSSARNFSPVLAGQSDFVTAMKYTAADTAGVGLGTMGGAKAGAMIGAFGGPIVAGAGAILGGLAGAIGGKWFAKNIKEKSLREAVGVFDDSLACYGSAYIEGLNIKAQALDNAAVAIMRRFNIFRLVAPTVGDVVRADVKRAYKRWAKSCRHQASAILKEAMPEGQIEPSYLIIGKTILSTPPDEAVYSPSIQECLNHIKAAVEGIESEKKKLGYK